MAIGAIIAGGRKLAKRAAKKSSKAKDSPKTAAARKMREENYDRMIAHESTKAANARPPRALAKEATASGGRRRASRALPAVSTAAAAAAGTKTVKDARNKRRVNRQRDR